MISRLRRTVVVAALLAGLATASVAFAQSSASFDLGWNVLGGGGGTESESAGFAVDSTIGQPIAGTSASGAFQIDSGFWAGAAGGVGPTPTVGPTSTPVATDTPVPAIDTPTPTAGPPTVTPTPGGLFGDADCNGTVNAIDAAFVLQFGAGLLGDIPCADLADANDDGAVTAIDAALILQFVAGFLGSLPP